MRLAYNILLFWIALNLSSFIMLESQILPISVNLPWQPLSQSDNILTAMFNLDFVSLLAGVAGGVAIGIIGLLLKQGLNVIYALIIYVIGVIFTPVLRFLTDLPIALSSIVPAESQWLIVVPLSIVSFAFFIFFIELLVGRNIS